MMYITLKTPTVVLKLDRKTMHNFCTHVLNNYGNRNKISKLHECGAIWLYNKVASKTKQSTCTLKMPLEYGIMLRAYCKETQPYSDLERVALYDILEQLDKKMK